VTALQWFDRDSPQRNGVCRIDPIELVIELVSHGRPRRAGATDSLKLPIFLFSVEEEGRALNKGAKDELKN
jgi:hypothetical protein